MNIRNYQKKQYKEGNFKDLSPEVLAYLDSLQAKDQPVVKESKSLKPVKEKIDIFKDA